jgi:hypothetical protein
MGDYLNSAIEWVANYPIDLHEWGPMFLIIGGGGTLLLSFIIPPIYRSVATDDLEFIVGKERPLSQVDLFELKDGSLLTRHFCRIGLKNNTKITLTGVHLRIEIIESVIETELPQSLRPRDDMPEKIELSPGKTEFWDFAKYWPDRKREKDEGIFLCFLRQEARGRIKDGNYLVHLVAFADNLPPARAQFRLIAEVDNLRLEEEMSFANAIKRFGKFEFWE